MVKQVVRWFNAIPFNETLTALVVRILSVCLEVCFVTRCVSEGYIARLPSGLLNQPPVTGGGSFERTPTPMLSHQQKNEPERSALARLSVVVIKT